MTGKNLRRSRYGRALAFLAAALLAWIAVSYLMLPEWWKGHERRHPLLDRAPRVTTTAAGIPGDPLNLLVIGSEPELVSALLAAGWFPADPITLETCIRIAESSIFHRPYEEAPVSNLYLFGRKEDLGFEKPAGKDPRARHHIRFWRAAAEDAGPPAWFAAATYDHGIGFSHTTGQITHHIAPEVDKERNLLMDDLLHARPKGRRSYENSFQASSGRNGGGDPWQSDGRLGVVELDEGK